MISHPYQCIFIHIPKTGGTSIESLFKQISQNEKCKPYKKPLLILKRGQSEDNPYAGHPLGRWFVPLGYTTDGAFSQYYKFTIVRNPWSRVASMYTFFGFQRKCSFNHFVQHYFSKEKWTQKIWIEKGERNSYHQVRPQYDFIYDNDGQCIVDHVGKFENIQEEFSKIAQHLKLPTITLPHHNKSNSKKAKIRIIPPIELIRYIKTQWIYPIYTNYKDYYNQELIDIVADRYKIDIDTFLYDY